MTYTILVLANRLPGISLAEFKARYETHMDLIHSLCAKVGPETFPLSHTRYYPLPNGELSAPSALDVDAGSSKAEKDGTEAETGQGNGIGITDVVVAVEFEDQAGWERFCAALGTTEAKTKIEEDEAGFWERKGMRVVVADRRRTWGPG